MNNNENQPEIDENDTFDTGIAGDTSEKNRLFEQIFSGNSEENLDIEEENIQEESEGRPEQRHRTKKGRYRKVVKLRTETLDETRETIDAILRSYQAGRLSESETRCMIYGLRLLVNAHSGLRIRRVEEDNAKIIAFFRKKGVNL